MDLARAQSRLSYMAAGATFLSVMGGLHWGFVLRLSTACCGFVGVLYAWYANVRAIDTSEHMGSVREGKVFEEEIV